MRCKNKLIIFVKNPEKGKVKTRLAASVGKDQALHIYNILTGIARNAALSTKTERQVWYSSYIEQNDEWGGGEFDKYLQEGDDLGERMRNAFKTAFASGADKVIIIGSDCPGITSGHIQSALQKLNGADAVIGPSEDGGYYLLGLRKFIPHVFEDIYWSTGRVTGQTKKILHSLNLQWEELEILNDIDTIEDLEADSKLKSLLND